MFDYYKLYEVSQNISSKHFDIPDWILYIILIFGMLMVAFGFFMFNFYSDSRENTGSLLLCFGIIICLVFAIIQGSVGTVKKNKKEFERIIKEGNIKTTPEKIISEADKLKSFCSYYYSENDDFCSLNFQGEVDQRTFNKVFKRIYESKADENKDKVEKAFEYITK